MPPNTVYVGCPTKWGNPFEIGMARCGCVAAGECTHNSFRRPTRQEAVDDYRRMVVQGAYRSQMLHELRGKNLACWCPLDQPCHADVLLELANR